MQCDCFDKFIAKYELDSADVNDRTFTNWRSAYMYLYCPNREDAEKFLAHACFGYGCLKNEPQVVNESKHIYELTLTTQLDDPKPMVEALKKICMSKMFKVSQFKACIELTEAGKPHIHACLWMDCKYVDVGKIKQFWKERYEFKKVVSLKNYLIYIEKESLNQNIADYCLSKDVKQIWNSW